MMFYYIHVRKEVLMCRKPIFERKPVSLQSEFKINIMNKHIRTILIVVLAIISYISAYGKSDTSDIHKLLDDVNEYLNEKPDSAWTILNSLDIPESEDGDTKAFFAILHAKAEYIVTDTIRSDSLLQKAIKYYNDEKSLRSSLAYYYLGCYHFGNDYKKAAYDFQRSIDYIPDGNDNQKGRAYHALGSCFFGNGSIDEGVKAYKTALKLIDEKESENTWKLCQDIKKALNEVNRVERENTLFAIFVILTLLAVIGLSGFIYYKVKKFSMVKTTKTKFSDDPLEQKLLEGKSKFEQTSAYKTLQEIRSLNENELHSRNDVDVKVIEDTIFASFYDAYHILAECESKISHQDLMLCLYSYLKITNNVAAFCLNSVPGTIRQRKNRLKSKLPENVYIILFS